MLSVKIYRNLRRIFCYGIYFNKFHAICKGNFQKCDHIYLAIHSHSALIFRLRCISIARKKNLLRSKLLFFFIHVCSTIFFNLYFIYLYRCYSYIICFHFKGWPKRRIIHIASSVVLQNAENVMSNSNIF
jgi:hypothetical protein